MVESAMISTPEVFTDNSTISYGPYVPVKQPSTRKFIRQISETLDVKPRTGFWRLCAAKSERKEIRSGRMLWFSIPKWHRHTKINECIKIYLYKWILHYHQFVHYPRANDCLKVYIDVKAGTQLVPDLLLEASVREIHNSMYIPPEEGGLKESRDPEDNIIIGNSTLRNIKKTQLKKKTSR